MALPQESRLNAAETARLNSVVTAQFLECRFHGWVGMTRRTKCIRMLTHSVAMAPTNFESTEHDGPKQSRNRRGHSCHLNERQARSCTGSPTVEPGRRC